MDARQRARERRWVLEGPALDLDLLRARVRAGRLTDARFVVVQHGCERSDDPVRLCEGLAEVGWEPLARTLSALHHQTLGAEEPDYADLGATLDAAIAAQEPDRLSAEIGAYRPELLQPMVLFTEEAREATPQDGSHAGRFHSHAFEPTSTQTETAEGMERHYHDVELGRTLTGGWPYSNLACCEHAHPIAPETVARALAACLALAAVRLGSAEAVEPAAAFVAGVGRWVGEGVVPYCLRREVIPWALGERDAVGERLGRD